MSDKKKVLQGYQKVGSKFVSPINNLPQIRSLSYVDFLLPELIWIGLINDNLGYVRAARFLEEIFSIIDSVAYGEDVEEDLDEASKDPYGNFAYISTFKKLDEEQKEHLRLTFERKELLSQLQNSLAPLILLYDQFPMTFIGPPQVIMEEKDLIERISECVGNHHDKYDTPGIVLHAAALLSRLVTGKIFFPKDMELPDFNSVISAPESDEAKRAAGFMRANVLGEFGAQEFADGWAKHFWQRGYELRPCKRV